MRRLIIEEPISRAAIWGRRIAWFSLPVLLAGIILMRKGGAEYTPGLAVICASVLLALVALQFSFTAFIQIWRKGRRGLGFATSALIVSLLVLVFPGVLMVRLLTVPYYADLSTNPEDLPAFSNSATALAARGELVPHAERDGVSESQANIVLKQTPGKIISLLNNESISAEKLLQFGQMQQRSHPNLKSRKVDASISDAFSRAKAVAREAGWTIIDFVPPGGQSAEGRLDAVKYTRILRIPIDITVRLRPDAEGTTIDVRSIPRYRLFDVGSEPHHIERYLQYFRAQS